MTAGVLHCQVLSQPASGEAAHPRAWHGFCGDVVHIYRAEAKKDALCFHRLPKYKLMQLMKVLMRNGISLHVRVIKDRLNKRMGQPSTSHAVHEFLSREREVFVRAGPGTFALREWGAAPKARP